MKVIGIFLLLACLSVAYPASARSVYLNGTDISSARGQQLKGVNVVIDEEGNVVIDAPHYKVHEESTYTPLSRLAGPATSMKHKAPQIIKNSESKDAEANGAKPGDKAKTDELTPLSDIPATGATAPTGAAVAPAPAVAAPATGEPKLIDKPGKKIDGEQAPSAP